MAINTKDLNRGEILQALRKEHNLTQAWVGESICGYTTAASNRCYISALETGRKLMTDNHIEEFSKLFNVSRSIFDNAPEGGTLVKSESVPKKENSSDQPVAKDYVPTPQEETSAITETTFQGASRKMIDTVFSLKDENSRLLSDIRYLTSQIRDLENYIKDLERYKHAYAELAILYFSQNKQPL